MNPFIPIIINFCVVISGWFILIRNARKLATRNETHTVLQKADDTLKRISELGREYWCNDRSDVETCKKYNDSIGTEIQHLRAYINILSNHSIICVSEFKLQEIRPAVTLDAEYKDSPSYDRSSMITQLILKKREELFAAFREIYKAY